MGSLKNQEKIKLIQDRIDVYQYHIDFLIAAIQEVPNGDHPEKRPRQEMLDEFIIKKRVLEEELKNLA